MCCYASSFILGGVPYIKNTSYSFLFGMLFILAKLAQLLIQRSWLRVPGVVYLIVLLPFYLAAFEWLWHDQSALNAYYLSFIFNCFMLALIVDEFLTNRDTLRLSAKFLGASSVLIAAFISLGFFISISESGRITFLDQNENELSAVLLVAFAFISLATLRNVSQNLAWVASSGVFCIILISAIVLTGTRFSIVAVAIILALLGATSVVLRINRQRTFIFIAACLAFLIMRSIDFSPTFERFHFHAANETNLADLGGRVPIWKVAIKAFIESPWVGMGYSGFSQYSLEQINYKALPHNFILTLAATAGSAGLLLFGVIVFYIAKKALHFDNRELLPDMLVYGVPLGLIMIMLNVSHLKIFWFLLAYVIAEISVIFKKNDAYRTRAWHLSQ